MLKKTIKDNFLRTSFSFSEPKYIISNFILKNKKIKNYLKYHFLYIIKYCNWTHSKVKFKNRCIFSGRSRSTYRFAKISRLFLRENSFINKIPGLQKSYW